jgi:PAS domain S-box-containing protein
MPIPQLKSYASIKPPMDEFLISTDEQFYITGITDFLVSISGIEKHKLIGTHISQFLRTDLTSPNNIIPSSFSSTVKSTFYVQALVPADNGNSIHAHWLVKPVTGEDGARSGFNWLGCKAESDLRGHVFDPLNLIENVSDSIVAVDLNMAIVTWNKASEDIYGYSAEEVKGKLLSNIVHYEYLTEDRETAKETLFRTGRWQGEVIYRRKDGEKIFLFSSVSLVKDTEGKTQGIVAVNRNITVRKEADAELVTKEKLLSAVASASNELLKRQDHLKVIEDCLAVIAKAAETDRVTLLQYLYNEEKKENYFSLKYEWHSENCVIPSVPSDFSYVSSSKTSKLVSILKNGQVYSYFVDDVRDPWFKQHLENHNVKSILIIPVITDARFWGVISWQQCGYNREWKKSEIDILKSFVITLSAAIERNTAYKKIQESEERLKALFQNSLDIVFVIDEELTVKYVTPAIEKVLGYVDNELVNSNWVKLVHEQDLRKIKRELKNVITYPENNLLINIRVLSASQEWMWMEVKGQNLLSNPSIKGIVLSLRDISERQNAQQILAAYSETISGILNSITDGFAALDKQFNVKLWNHVAEKVTGIANNQIIGHNLWEEFPFLLETTLSVECKKAASKNITVNFELHFSSIDRWFDVSIYPYDDGLFIYFKDVTEKKKQEMLLALEKNVLEINSKRESTLKTTVDYFLNGIEQINPGVICSVLILDDMLTVKHLSAPALPVEYTEKINGLPIGPEAGSCGTAMHKKETIIVEDISTSHLWTGYAELALSYNLRACWSIPILNAQEKVMGSFACYYKEPKFPTIEEYNLIERTANLLRVIIENKTAEEQVRISNDRYILATRATNEAIWDWDIKTDVLYWGEGFYSLFGYRSDEKVNTFKFWESHIHPEDQEKVKQGIEDFIRNQSAHLWIDEYRYQKADGSYAIVLNKGYLIHDSNGNTVRMVGSIEDVTEKKRLEKKLIKQEIDKQKLVAQAVVDAQEKERAEIGKELHDNVNQILSTAKLFLEVAKTSTRERAKLISRSAEQIHHAINEIRNISRSLVPPSISDLGLIESIKDLLDDIAVTKTIKVDFTNVGDIEGGINDNQKLMLFRIIQEQVSNVLKHAEAKHLSIKLSVDNVGIELVIADDGKGFDLENNKTKKGVGLSNIASRVELFNGKVNIVTAPGKGCRLIVKVLPISNYK